MISQNKAFAISFAQQEAINLDRTIFVMHRDDHGNYGTFDDVGKEYVNGHVIAIAKLDGTVRTVEDIKYDQEKREETC